MTWRDKSEEAVKEELKRRMAEYRAEYSDNMSAAEAVLAGLILKDEMKIPVREWKRFNLGDGKL